MQLDDTESSEETTDVASSSDSVDEERLMTRPFFYETANKYASLASRLFSDYFMIVL
jgi:hypothetical protein